MSPKKYKIRFKIKLDRNFLKRVDLDRMNVK